MDLEPVEVLVASEAVEEVVGLEAVVLAEDSEVVTAENLLSAAVVSAMEVPLRVYTQCRSR